jgi:antitoxin (DNA-binding transcriptional repressor) of toxin-antitoxin stability system
MSLHSVAEASRDLLRLIDRALQGEPVVIARDGQPIVELRPIPPPPRPVTEADLAWIDEHRVGKAQAGLDAATEVRRMRDEAEFWECVSADAWDDLG